MTVEYVGTEVAACPNCGDRVPGHVRKVTDAGVHFWGCPACNYSCKVENLDEKVSVSVLLEAYGRLEFQVMEA